MSKISFIYMKLLFLIGSIFCLHNFTTHVESYSINKNELRKKEEDKLFPFKKSKSKIEDSSIIGMKIRGNKKILLAIVDKQKLFSIEPINEEEDFSNLNFFRQYENLLSVEFKNITFTNRALENIQKFLPENINNIIIDDCIFENGSAKLLADLYRKHQQINHIILHHPSFDVDEIKTITSSLAKYCGNMRYISFAFGEITQNSCEKIAKLLKNSKNLHTFSLAFKTIKEKDDKKSYKILSSAIKKLKFIKSLKISIIQGAQKRLEKLLSSMESKKSLISLSLFFGNIEQKHHIKAFEFGESIEKTIESLPNLKALDISSMHLPGEAMQTISQSISKLNNLEILNFSGNTIDTESAKILADSFKELSILNTLIIKNCDLDDMAFTSIMHNISELPIKTLYASHNKISNAVRNIPINKMSELLMLDLSNNLLQFKDVFSMIEKINTEHDLKIIKLHNNSEMHKNSKEDTLEQQNINAEYNRNQLDQWELKNNSNIVMFGI